MRRIARTNEQVLPKHKRIQVQLFAKKDDDRRTNGEGKDKRSPTNDPDRIHTSSLMIRTGTLEGVAQIVTEGEGIPAVSHDK